MQPISNLLARLQALVSNLLVHLQALVSKLISYALYLWKETPLPIGQFLLGLSFLFVCFWGSRIIDTQYLIPPLLGIGVAAAVFFFSHSYPLISGYCFNSLAISFFRFQLRRQPKDGFFLIVFMTSLSFIALGFHFLFFKGEAPLFIVIAGGACCLYFRYMTQDPQSRLLSLFGFLLSNGILGIIFSNKLAALCSFLASLLVLFTPVSLDTILLVQLIGRCFVHPVMGTLGVSLLIYLSLVDALVFLEKGERKPFFPFLVFIIPFLIPLLGHSLSISHLFLPAAGGAFFFLTFLSTTSFWIGYSYIFYCRINIFLLLFIGGNVVATCLFLVLNLFVVVYLKLLSRVRQQSLHVTVMETWKEVCALFLCLLAIIAVKQPHLWIADSVHAFCFQIAMIYLLKKTFLYVYGIPQKAEPEKENDV